MPLIIKAAQASMQEGVSLLQVSCQVNQLAADVHAVAQLIIPKLSAAIHQEEGIEILTEQVDALREVGTMPSKTKLTIARSAWSS